MRRIFIFILFLCFFTSCQKSEGSYVQVDNGERIKVKIADEQEERRKGLMGVEHMPDREGMLFVWEEDVNETFWMKDTLISLDIIFISSDYEVLDVISGVPICESHRCLSYGIDEDFRFVMELNVGESKEMGIEKGDKLKFLNIQ